MASHGQKKLNKDDVRNGILRFVLSFVVLLTVSFLTVFLFFRSSEVQKRQIQNELNDYKSVLSRNELLKIKMDTIYYKMALLNSNKVENDIFLRNSILEDLRDNRNIMGSDTAKAFKQYATLTKNIGKMTVFKNELINITAKEQNALRSLNECMGKVGKMNSQLKSKEPGGKIAKRLK
ncbi:type VI secretion system TssO [Epilithonimonas lactis]|uniref:Uncharacterized protein n=1 Tax=Epilithonimonas lactis TaxID=421072 RepID=A0A085B7E8_9FLAO|nr:type VI secretion system TssO [Epilithonimonas lactis]KFC18393.1 hypothetical protein IO89_18040 [Epilithonimonas lactis]SER02611.1 hypothetical protein SAMN04488097_3694 [Epilithonimonas lactis]